MSCEFRYRCQTGILPDNDLILGITVRADQFRCMFAPGQVANLATCIHALHRLSCQSIPETDEAVSGTSAGSKEAVVVWRPRDGLDGSLVLRVGLARRVRL